jgi:hypothetical protein
MINHLGATLGATRPNSMAEMRTRSDNDRQVNPHGRIDLNEPEASVGAYGSDGPVPRAQG